ncbi:MAG: hypothetical protein MZV70_72095 [Desulfobacterales bacterium]|nr:hypothetical protein [Desulfobacterales bacterium]
MPRRGACALPAGARTGCACDYARHPARAGSASSTIATCCRACRPWPRRTGSFLPVGRRLVSAAGRRCSPTGSTLSVPGDQRALVPGPAAVRGDVPGRTGAGRYRARFEFAQPADGIDLMAGPWVVREKIMPRAERRAAAPAHLFLPRPGRHAGPGGRLPATTRARYLERYGEEIGAYPFTEFSVVASPLPTGFGMPTLTYLGAEVLKPALHPRHLARPRGAAQLVGQRRATSTTPSGNWSEGLTTFMADYAYKERRVRRGGARDAAGLAARLRRACRPAATSPLAELPLAHPRRRGGGRLRQGGDAVRDAARCRSARRPSAAGIRAFWAGAALPHRRLERSCRRRSSSASGSCRSDAFFEQWLIGARRRGGDDRAGAMPAARPARASLTTRPCEQSGPAARAAPAASGSESDGPRRDALDRRASAVRRRRSTLPVDAVPRGACVSIPKLRVWRRAGPRRSCRPSSGSGCIAPGAAGGGRRPRAIGAVREAAAGAGRSACSSVPHAEPVRGRAEARAASRDAARRHCMRPSMRRWPAPACRRVPPTPGLRGGAQVWTVMRAEARDAAGRGLGPGRRRPALRSSARCRTTAGRAGWWRRRGGSRRPRGVGRAGHGGAGSA